MTVFPTFEINDFPVTRVSTAKSLEATILDRGIHVENILKKVSSIGAIKRVRHLIPKATLFLIYRSLILPHFNYCNTV